MKKIALFALAVFLMGSGVTLAQQSAEGKKDSSMQGMMQEMMKQGSERNMQGMGSMGGMNVMMGMMRMMEQCSDMMKSAHHHGEKTKESQNK